MTREQLKTHAARQDGLRYLAVMGAPAVDVRYIVRSVECGRDTQRLDDLTLDEAIAWLRRAGVPADGRETLYVAATLDGEPLNAIYASTPAPGSLSDERGYITINAGDDLDERIRDIEWLEPEYRLEMIAREN